jgi:hypothetical protein
LDLAGADQAGEALVKPRDDAVLVGVDPGHVDALERALDAELLTLPRQVGHLGGVQKRFGGDAAAVQASATDLVLLDKDDAHAELRRT